MKKSFVQQLFNSLNGAKATSQETSLTAREIAENYGYNIKNTSTVLGNLHRKKLANRSLEVVNEGERRQYKYWVMPGADGRALFHASPAPIKRGARKQTKKQVAQERIEQYHGRENYVMTITGPHDFAMKMTVEPSKLSQVIGAANGGQ